MTQSTLAPGIYTFYAGNTDGRSKLYSINFDGVTMGTPLACAPSGNPNLIGSPCAFYDRDGAYAGDHLPRIHVFVVAEKNTVWWLSTIDGVNFITHSEDLVNVQTLHRFGAVLLDDGIHLYFAELQTNRILHAWSNTDWAFQTVELLFTENETAAWGVSAVLGDKLYILFGNGSSQPNLPQNNLQLFYLEPGTGSNDGNGQFVSQGPDPSLDIQLYDSPAATMLGGNLVVPYKGTGHGGQQAYFATKSEAGVWSNPEAIPNAQTTNSVGSCCYGSRLFCIFQSSSDNSMFLQAYIGHNWLPNAIQIAQNEPLVFWGPAAVAVERDGAVASSVG